MALTCKLNRDLFFVQIACGYSLPEVKGYLSCKLC